MFQYSVLTYPSFVKSANNRGPLAGDQNAFVCSSQRQLDSSHFPKNSRTQKGNMHVTLNRPKSFWNSTLFEKMKQNLAFRD